MGTDSPLFFYKTMKDSIIKSVESFVKSKGLMFIDCTIRGERSTKVLEVFVDDIDPISLDKIGKMNTELWNELEAEDLSNDISKVIVSSPGVDKSFRYPEQLFKHIGRTLDIKMKNGSELTGELNGILNTGKNYLIEIKVTERNGNKVNKETESLEFDEISESKVKLKFK